MRALAFLLLSFLLSSQVVSQTKVYDIKNPEEDKEKHCAEYITLRQDWPNEARFGITIKNDELYLIFSGKATFEKLFDDDTDGFAIDIIHKDQYACGKPNILADSWVKRGALMAPLYRKDFEIETVNYVTQQTWVRYGKLPKQFNKDDVEFNLVLLEKKWFCDYHSTISIDFGNLSLLQTGLYRDSVKRENLKSPQFVDLLKTVAFEVPFERNQTTFKEADIQPIHDTLNLTKYFIKDMEILAYSSIEGSRLTNLRLQKGRGQSLVAALKAYQGESMLSEVESEENWGDFYRDIEGTEFAYLKKFRQKEIKAKLSADRELLNAMEPILSKHRKAKVVVSLERRIGLETNDTAMLQRFFDQSVANKNVDEALYIQAAIFDKVKNDLIPEDFASKLEVPETLDYGPLLNNREIFRSERSLIATEFSIANFEKLLEMLPGNLKLIFNITALKIKLWTTDGELSEGMPIMKNINTLETAGFNSGLIKRLRTNYRIVLTSYLSLEGRFREKNRVLRELFDQYQTENLTDKDMLDLAKYLSNYSQKDWAIQLMDRRVQEEDVSEDLIIYYLTLTISNKDFHRSPTYMGVLDNARELYPEPYCHIFKPKSLGGASFQLLDAEVLKSRFCESCSGL